MARKKGSRKINVTKYLVGFLSEKSFFIRPVTLFVLGAAILSGAFLGGRHFFLNSRFFRIEDVVVNKDRGYSFRNEEQKIKKLYVGRNIFSVDLDQLQVLMKNDFPQLRDVEARRNLPNRLEIDIVTRKPVAVIDAGRGIVIDREGVVLAVGEGTGSLVKIKGLRFFLKTPKVGQCIRNEALDRAVVLLEGMRKKLGGKEKDIEYVDISDAKNLVLGISGVKVKMGTDDFSRKIDELREILDDPNMDFKDIKYIDLRFEGGVISPR